MLDAEHGIVPAPVSIVVCKINTEEILFFDALFGKSKAPANPELYDYESAKGAGIKPDETGHWSSRVPSGPKEGLILKDETHPTFGLTVEGEAKAGYKMYRGPDGKVYSYPESQVVPEGYQPYEPAVNREFDAALGGAAKPVQPQPEAGGVPKPPGAPLQEATSFPELGPTNIESPSQFKTEAPEQTPGAIESLGRGLAHGTITSIGSLFGTVPKWFGNGIGSESMVEWGLSAVSRPSRLCIGDLLGCVAQGCSVLNATTDQGQLTTDNFQPATCHE